MANPRFNPKLARRNDQEKFIPQPIQSLIEKYLDRTIPYGNRETYGFQLIDIQDAIFAAQKAYGLEGLDRVNNGRIKKVASKSLKQ